MTDPGFGRRGRPPACAGRMPTHALTHLKELRKDFDEIAEAFQQAALLSEQCRYIRLRLDKAQGHVHALLTMKLTPAYRLACQELDASCQDVARHLCATDNAALLAEQYEQVHHLLVCYDMVIDSRPHTQKEDTVVSL